MADAILSPEEMKAVEKTAFADGIEAESLMDRAGEGIADAILELEPHPGVCVVYLGKGNNAGDAIVAGALLAKAGWEIWVRFSGFRTGPAAASQEKIAGSGDLSSRWPAHGSTEKQTPSDPGRFARTWLPVRTDGFPKGFDTGNKCLTP